VAKVTQAHIESRSAAILEAAIRMFARKGIGAATMQDVATEAGLSAGAIYRYYPSKDVLLKAIFARLRAENEALFTQASLGSASPIETLLNTGRVVGERLRGGSVREANILQLEAILDDARRSDELVAESRQLRRAYLALTERVLRQAQLTGGLDPDIDTQGLAVMFLACMIGVQVLALEVEDAMEMEPVLQVITEMLRRFAPKPAIDDIGMEPVPVLEGSR
jgi:TetR/AcrR family transcriptional regulator, transcriptional repressor of aconitase